MTHKNRILLSAFGESVRAARERLGYSQEELAEASGLHRTYISGVERGLRNVSLSVLFRLSAALGIKPGCLTDEAFELHGGEYEEEDRR